MCVPEVIGKKGATIRKLRRASGCRVWVEGEGARLDLKIAGEEGAIAEVPSTPSLLRHKNCIFRDF